jgi:hypothetical protein
VYNNMDRNTICKRSLFNSGLGHYFYFCGEFHFSIEVELNVIFVEVKDPVV